MYRILGLAASTKKKSKESFQTEAHWWLTPGILATWEAKMRPAWAK
jgi:hypothetical protein